MWICETRIASEPEDQNMMASIPRKEMNPTRGKQMKLRIKRNSLRLRVSRSEVTKFLMVADLEETVRFGPEASAKLTYALQQEPSAHALSIRYTENKVAILVPLHQAIAWGVTDQVEIARDINLGDAGTLSVLIEKDFACLDGSDEDNRDAFPNPNAGARC